MRSDWPNKRAGLPCWVLALVVAACSSSQTQPASTTPDPSYDLDAVLAGTPTPRTLAVASALQAQLSSDELDALRNLDWRQESSRLYSDTRISRAFFVAAAILQTLPAPPAVSPLTAKSRPLSCDPECVECMERWQTRLRDFGTQINSAAWTCGLSAVAAVATGGITIPGWIVTCGAVVSMLYFEYNAYRNDLLTACALRKTRSSRQVQKDIAGDLRNFLQSCRNRDDGGAPDGGAPDGGAPDGGAPNSCSATSCQGGGRFLLSCGGQRWCVVAGATCCENGGCQCGTQTQGPGTICCAASTGAWCQYWQGNGCYCHRTDHDFSCEGP